MAFNLLPQDGELHLFERVLSPQAAQTAFHRLTAELDWRQESMAMMGRSIPVPRLTAFYGDVAYKYSGIDHPPRPLTPTLVELGALADRRSGAGFNTVLANLYRDGADGMGWHADDEKELGRNPVIASLSLGGTRHFQLKHRTRADLRLDLELTAGSLLIMTGSLQHFWLHRLPKTRKAVEARINLTFREVGRSTVGANSPGFAGGDFT